jgi:hypothetical protein
MVFFRRGEWEQAGTWVHIVHGLSGKQMTRAWPATGKGGGQDGIPEMRGKMSSSSLQAVKQRLSVC